MTIEDEEDIEQLFLKLPTSSSSTSINQEWNKNSWRRNEGKKSRGRVKGIAQVFENGEVDELGRRNSLKSNAELDEVARIRRSRQESTDSDFSTISNRSAASYKRMSLPIISLNNQDKVAPHDISSMRTPREEASESESEGEDTFGSSTNHVDWASVEPIAPEETAALSEGFFADLSLPSSSSSSPSTPCASTFVLPTSKDQASTVSSIREKTDEDVEESYQSHILSHGTDAYAAIRSRKQSDLSEVTDELSEEHLAYWNNLPEEDQRPRSPYSPLPSPATQLNCATKAVEEEDKEVDDLLARSSAMVFAESDGNIITMKKHHQSNPASIAKRTRSFEDFGSLKFQTVQSRLPGKASSPALKDLFEEHATVHEGDMDTAGRFGITNRKKKHSRRLSDFFRESDEVSISKTSFPDANLSLICS